jgi:hypothetical protein
MTPTELTALADRVEAAKGPDRELFLEAWRAVNPRSAFASGYASDVRRGRFLQLCDMGAWLDAAMSLVPEGWHTHLATEDRHSHSWSWTLRGGYGWEAKSRAAKGPLALVAAALRANEQAGGL